MQKRRNWLQKNNLLERVRATGMDQEVVQAYERYIMAHIWHIQQGVESVITEQQKAIESLTHGTLYFYHLHFIDLSKRMDFDNLSDKDQKLYKKFKAKFSKTREFLEVETAFHLMQKVQKLPKSIDDQTSQENIDSYLELVDYIDTQINQSVYESAPQPPTYMSTLAQHEDQSDVSEENHADALNLQCFDVEKHCSRDQLINSFIQKMKKASEYYEDQNKFDESNMPYTKIKYMQILIDIDWKQFDPIMAYNCAKTLAQHDDVQKLQLFEMTNESFFDQFCTYLHQKLKKMTDKDKKYHQKQKFVIDEYLFNAMTLDQMDKINKNLRNVDIDIKENKVYVEAYFSKQFSDELSTEYFEHQTNEDKFKNLEGMYQYAKSTNLHKGLISSLLQQMLNLTLKLGTYREDLFQEYLERPTEVNHYLKEVEVKRKNKKDYSKLQSQGGDLINKYLKLICLKNNGSLEAYEKHFEINFLRSIEKKIRIQLSDTGLDDLDDEISSEEFKKYQDLVIIQFTETNKEKFTVNEKVTITLELKNIPELVIKIFEFNAETYYRKTMKPLDTSIDLQGLDPSFIKTETEIFKGIQKNKIITHTFEFNELKNKIGTFIIEFQGNGKLGRAIIKKGSLTLIHRTTIGGHIAYIIDEQRNICKSDDRKTGVLVDEKFYPTDINKNGAIFIPYTQDNYAKHQDLILITDGFAQLGQFMRETEKYDLQAFFHLNSESILVGQKTKLLVRAKLTLNRRAVSIKFLKNCQFDMAIIDHEGKQIHHTVQDPKF